MQHEHHNFVVSNTRVILDHAWSVETMILKGVTREVRALADAIRAERGVRFGAINIVSVCPNDSHDHPNSHYHHNREHVSPHPG